MTDPEVRQPLRVGVAGAGPWSRLVHAPMVAAHPDTELTGVWARRLPAAEEVARPYGATAHDSFERFLSGVDAVAFAVPPDIQVGLAVAAARAGKALLLEKPLALDLDGAERLVREVDRAGVATQMVLTWRYEPAVRTMLDRAEGASVLGGRGRFLTGGFLGGMFATPWRIEHGPLLDLGPHVIDLLDAALGPVTGIRAHGDPHRWVGLLLDHRDGSSSEASLTAYSPVQPSRAGVEIYTTGGVLEVDTAELSPSVTTTIVDEFVATVRTGAPHPLDVGRGLYLQRLMDEAARHLR